LNDIAPPHEASAAPPAPRAPVSPDAGRAPAPPAAWLAAVAAWFLPGFGHLLLRRWGRAAIIFVCAVGMAVAGYKMRGRVYSMRSEDIFGRLNHFAEIGTGAFYFLAPIFEPAGADTARVVGDLGTRFLDIAGLLNFLCAADAFLIARKSKS
jgi:Family of unknown function (DUF6677)